MESRRSCRQYLTSKVENIIPQKFHEQLSENPQQIIVWYCWSKNLAEVLIYNLLKVSANLIYLLFFKVFPAAANFVASNPTKLGYSESYPTNVGHQIKFEQICVNQEWNTNFICQKIIPSEQKNVYETMGDLEKRSITSLVLFPKAWKPSKVSILPDYNVKVKYYIEVNFCHELTSWF